MRRALLLTLASSLALLAPSPAAAQDLPGPPPEEMDQEALQALADARYPSATACAACHPRQFADWSYSSHAYASLSPMFNKFEQAINDFSQGTINYFCLRCHASVATALGERRDFALWQRAKASREGITCISCHRIAEAYGKVNGERRITPGDIQETVHGPFDTAGYIAMQTAPRLPLLMRDQEDREGYLRFHGEPQQSAVISQSEFCVACHQVQVHPGIKLETVWEEYRNSPAAKEGISCQDCHMGRIAGQPSGYDSGAAAVVPRLNGGEWYYDQPRKLTDHSFIGPGYPISHPGLFPISAQGSPFTDQEWLTFDYRAGWGSAEFEDGSGAGSAAFPPEWQDRARREEAWGIVRDNLGRWEDRRKLRLQLMEGSSRVDGPFFDGRLEVGRPLTFRYTITNLNKGHNMPSGSLGAQPQLWLNVALIDPDGERIWESGYLDSVGDLADIHSREVAAGTVEHDGQLVNLEAMFLTTNVKGTDREMYLPVNFDVDQIPFIRPGNVPVSVLNHPPGARMEKRSIPPLGTRTAKYKVPGKLITKPGTYRLAVRLRSRSEPIYFMDFVGATMDMKRSMNEWITDIHPYAVEFDVR